MQDSALGKFHGHPLMPSHSFAVRDSHKAPFLKFRCAIVIKPDEPDVSRKGWLCNIKSQCSIQDSDKPMDSLAPLARGLLQSSGHQAGRHLGLHALCASTNMVLELRMYE